MGRVRGHQLLQTKDLGFQILNHDSIIPRCISPYHFSNSTSNNVSEFVVSGTQLTNTYFYHNSINNNETSNLLESELHLSSQFSNDFGRDFCFSESVFDFEELEVLQNFFFKNFENNIKWCILRHSNDFNKDYTNNENIKCSGQGKKLKLELAAKGKNQLSLNTFMSEQNKQIDKNYNEILLYSDTNLLTKEVNIILVTFNSESKKFEFRLFLLEAKSQNDLFRDPSNYLSQTTLILDIETTIIDPYGEEIIASDGIINEWFARDFHGDTEDIVVRHYKHQRKSNFLKSPSSTIQQDITDCVFEDLWSEIVVILYPLIDIIAQENKSGQISLTQNYDDEVIQNLASAMTIRPVPLQKREWSAKIRSMPLEIELPRPQSAKHNISRPQSSRPQSAAISKSNLSISRPPSAKPDLRGTSAAISKYQNMKRNNGGMSIGQGKVNEKPTWDARPSTSISKRLPPLKFSIPQDDAQKGSRHVIFESEEKVDVVNSRPFTARRQPRTTQPVRAKSARLLGVEERLKSNITSSSVNGTRLSQAIGSRRSVKIK
ncbi:hypothetical protein HK099_003886 [Clydaea vesicula]|uniref:Uncharacterized protein n=1 Tax=Clydaea vesicula TaxID=447962 RepID=A0AAD5U4C1_9FUNG|nr:hypothetical protein HK099_003886 [Clydaea vesicula]